MHYLVLSNIEIQQVPSDQYPGRSLYLQFKFMNKYEGSSTWEDLTQTLCLVLPKNVVVNSYNTTAPFEVIPQSPAGKIKLGNVKGQSGNLGGFTDAPVFMCGDLVRFNVGYRAFVSGKETTYMTGQDGIPDQFKGFISAVSPKLPFTLHCEDNMWLLKQMPTPAKNWANKTLQQIVETVIADSQNLPTITRYQGYVKLKVSDFSKTDLVFNVRNLTTNRGSLAVLLARLKSEYQVDSYFRGDELRIGLLHYVQEDTVEHTFTFQKNILDGDKLTWQRKDDKVLSMLVKSNYLIESAGTNLDGTAKTKHACTEILIYNDAGTFTYITKEKGKDFPTKYLNQIGENYKMNIQSDITDPKKLFDLGVAQLKKRYYDGFKGCFTTLGIPYVKHGDTVRLVNKRLPEQDGLYKVKGVNAFGGVDDGLRQEIHIDYKIG
jgi:hypothetical protein